MEAKPVDRRSGSYPGDPEKWERAEAELAAWATDRVQITRETFEFLDAMLRKMLSRSSDPDEIACEAWLWLSRYSLSNWRDDLQREPNFPRWFFYSARLAIGNAIRSLYGSVGSGRREARATAVSLSPEDKALRAAIEPPVFDDEYVERDGSVAAPPTNFRALTKALPPDDRAILEIRFVDGAKLGEIAGLLGISQAGASSRIQGALRRIRRIHGIDLQTCTRRGAKRLARCDERREPA